MFFLINGILLIFLLIKSPQLMELILVSVEKVAKVFKMKLNVVYFYRSCRRNKKLISLFGFSVLFTHIFVFSGLYIIQWDEDTYQGINNISMGADLVVTSPYENSTGFLSLKEQINADLDKYFFPIIILGIFRTKAKTSI